MTRSYWACQGIQLEQLVNDLKPLDGKIGLVLHRSVGYGSDVWSMLGSNDSAGPWPTLCFVNNEDHE